TREIRTPAPSPVGERWGDNIEEIAAGIKARQAARNSVGERLTRELEEDEWVVRFGDDETPVIFQWKAKYKSIVDNHRYYRWLGRIPQEPKEEKVEPPKSRGLVG